MKKFAKIYTVQFYDAAHDIAQVQVFTQNAMAWEYFLKLRRELLGSRNYVCYNTDERAFEGYLHDDMGRDYIEYQAWDLNQLPHK